MGTHVAQAMGPKEAPKLLFLIQPGSDRQLGTAS